ncbi:porin [Curvibacter gracilis]|uniref:porin n=1 Tax=Curvibacter gracilis TaxID=230310 RepID=UPI0004878CF5|nr:porin [Curvibacter gracilis]
MKRFFQEVGISVAVFCPWLGWAQVPVQARAQAPVSTQAQAGGASVQLFGVIDVSLGQYQTAGGAHSTAMGNSNHSKSRLGLQGREDLGQGLWAGFWLEGAVEAENGNSRPFAFERRSTLSLGAAPGELRLGRDFTPVHLSDSQFDPFNATGVGANLLFQVRSSGTGPGRVPIATGFGANNPVFIRANNAITYVLPPGLGGWSGRFQVALPNRLESGAASAGRHAAGRLAYQSGAAGAALAWAHTAAFGGAGPTALPSPEVQTVTLAGSYPLPAWGQAILSGELLHERYRLPDSSRHSRGWMVGASLPLGRGALKASYAQAVFDLGPTPPLLQTPRVNKWALGYVLPLGKRFEVYATVARIRNQGGARMAVSPFAPGQANAASTGFELGGAYSF